MSNVAECCYRAKLGNFFVLACCSNVEACADQLLELENLRELFLREQIDLEAQMRPLVSADSFGSA
jgi:hypothetical protein